MRLDTERQKELEPERMDYACRRISDLGYPVIKKNDTTIQFFFKNEPVTLYPYSGWHTGKSIKDGRGIEKLLNQLKN